MTVSSTYVSEFTIELKYKNLCLQGKKYDKWSAAIPFSMWRVPPAYNVSSRNVVMYAIGQSIWFIKCGYFRQNELLI